MTKQTSKQGGPSGDHVASKVETGAAAAAVMEESAIARREKRSDAVKKTSSSVSSSSKAKVQKEKTQGSGKKSVGGDAEREKRERERKERERREWERYERDVIEAERKEKELEFERWEREQDRERERARKGKVTSSVSRYKPRKPPAGYKDPHDACKPVLSTKVKEERRQEIKALMNCIAYDEEAPSADGDKAGGKVRAAVEEMDNSMSSDTTSDMTDVTPRSSSSGCSSMSKQSVNLEKAEAAKSARSDADVTSKRTKSKTETEVCPRTTATAKKLADMGRGKGKGDNQETEAEVNEEELEEMKYLEDAFEDLDIDDQATDFASSIITGLSEERRAKCGRKNMTFTNEQLREIERVNLILLKKIMGQRKPRTKSLSQPPVNRKTSAAINRTRMEERIERENKILLKKLQSAKGTTGTLSRKGSHTQAYY